MANIRIRLNAPSDQRWSGTLPVEIRDLNTAVLQTRGFSGGTINVPPGRYLVTATLPNGEQAGGSEIVELQKEEESREVELTLEKGFPPASLAAPWTDPLKAAANTVSNWVAPQTSWLTPQPCALVRGVQLGALLDIGVNGPPPERIAVARSTIDVNASDEPALLEIGTESSCSYFSLPVDANGSTTAQWRIDAPAQSPSVRFDFNGPATAFFDYVQGGFAPQSRTLSRGLIQQGEDYFRNKGSRLAATLAAYVLLRANELDHLDAWTKLLRRYHREIPDTLPIRTEYLARAGRHKEAADLLRFLPDIGIPWFRSGLVYAAARAKYYNSTAGQTGDDLAMSAGKVYYEKITPALASLAEKLDFSASTTVLHGLARIEWPPASVGNIAR